MNKIKSDVLKRLKEKLEAGELSSPLIDIENNIFIEHEVFLSDKITKFDMSYMRMAHIWAQNSYAVRRKVGCIIVKDNIIISDGFNGTLAGLPNVCESEDGKQTLNSVVHSEFNAITKLARSHNSCQDATAYVTLSPCFQCSKLLISSGIKRIVFGQFHWDLEGLEWLVMKKIPLRFVDKYKLSWDDVQIKG